MLTNIYSKYEEFYSRATNNYPYPYQVKLASDENISFPSVINIPTGVGKTSAIVLSWIWRRRYHSREKIRENTPRRLVYCLPMRVLVEQTRDNITLWLDRLGILGGNVDSGNYTPDFKDPQKIPVVVLMGGEDSTKWDIYPDRDMVIIGTQDMLISREINRGYGMSKYRWPLHFGLLNNDSLWVLDEIQLMGSGLVTSLQMESFRKDRGTLKGTKSVWMSATLEPEWLKTVDFNPETEIGDGILSLTENDTRNDAVRGLISSHKKLRKIEVQPSDFSKIAQNVLEHHIKGTTTVVIMNTVEKAQKLFEGIKREVKNQDILMIHSQFRPLERENIVRKLLTGKGSNDRIVISTQVIEAGVDVSSRTLITEVAPWASMVQRFGRCNRYGEYQEANVFWLDYGEGNVLKQSPPYNPESVEFSRRKLMTLEDNDVSPSSLPKLDYSISDKDVDAIRSRDIYELFDNTTDIMGEDIDISRFVRDANDTHVLVFWRNISGHEPDESEPLPFKFELCPAPINDLKKMIGDKVEAWLWDYYEGIWVKLTDPKRIVPGLEVMLKSANGCYDVEIGWTPKSRRLVTPVNTEIRNAESYDDNSSSYLFKSEWKSISEHSDDVVEIAEGICNSLNIDSQFKEAIIEAARWHDYGKAHPEFQARIRRDQDGEHGNGYLAAKAPREFWNTGGGRRHFRHELVSGLVALKILEERNNPNAALIAYLAASHHGKVRVSIRSLPDEDFPDDVNVKFARGVWDADKVPSVDLGGGETVPEMKLDLSPMVMGQNSWLSKVLSLCDDGAIGIFRLAFMEAIVKASDERASGGL